MNHIDTNLKGKAAAAFLMGVLLFAFQNPIPVFAEKETLQTVSNSVPAKEADTDPAPEEPTDPNPEPGPVPGGNQDGGETGSGDSEIPDPSSEVDPELSSKPESELSSGPESELSSGPESELSSEPEETSIWEEPSPEPEVTPEESYEEEYIQNTEEEEPPPPPSQPIKKAVVRPKATIKPSFGPDDTTTDARESNYVTFATLNRKQSSFSQHLFLAGLISIAVGVVGWLVLILQYLRRRRLPPHENEEIFAAIQEAEDRSHRPADDTQYFADEDALYAPQAADDDLYEEDYSAPDERAQYLSEDPYANFVTPSEPYTAENYDEYPDAGYSTDYGPSMADAARQASDPAAHIDSSPTRPVSYDTEEILREALNFNSHEN